MTKFEVEEALASEEQGFSIKDDTTCDWAIKKIKAEEAEFERLKSIGAEQILQIEDEIKMAETKKNNKVEFLTRALQSYFNTVEHKKTKTAESYKLLSGSLVMNLPKKEMVPNNDNLIKYLSDNGYNDYLKQEIKPAWGEFKKILTIVDDKVILTETGEELDCVGIEDKPGKFIIK